MPSASTTVIFSLLALAALHHHVLVAEARTFTIINKCAYTVWPGLLSNAGVAPLPSTGFALQKGESKAIVAPPKWAGRFWGRTFCSSNPAGKFTCKTGDCGSGKIECSGAGAQPPATLAEFTLDGADSKDFYDVSLVDGYNLPMLVAPKGGKGPNCTMTGCEVDLNGACPAELRVTKEGDGSTVACRSACEKFNTPEYCCSGAYGSPDTCKPSSYSQIFKKACPRAYSYAYDDKSSTFTCTEAPDYTVTFCPSSSASYLSMKPLLWWQSGTQKTSSMTNPNMKYEGVSERSSAPQTFLKTKCSQWNGGRGVSAVCSSS